MDKVRLEFDHEGRTYRVAVPKDWLLYGGADLAVRPMEKGCTSVEEDLLTNQPIGVNWSKIPVFRIVD